MRKWGRALPVAAGVSAVLMIAAHGTSLEDGKAVFERREDTMKHMGRPLFLGIGRVVKGTAAYGPDTVTAAETVASPATPLRRAGVGIGTLYRHFPTREALFEAVYRREVEQLGELAEQLESERDPVDALRRWLKSNVEFVATKKGMVAALALAAAGSSELHAFSFE